MTIRETILGLIAGIACILALLALQYAGMARKSRDTHKERYDSLKGLLWYVPDEQWETYVNQRLKKLGKSSAQDAPRAPTQPCKRRVWPLPGNPTGPGPVPAGASPRPKIPRRFGGRSPDSFMRLTAGSYRRTEGQY
jgi:hypothetical protein